MNAPSQGSLPFSGSGGARSRLPTQPSRKTVSRACDWCRVRRIRCDNGEPCRACQQRGAECTHKGLDEPRTLPAALREIDRLKLRVKELEAEVQRQRTGVGAAASLPTPDSAPDRASRGYSHQSTSQSLPSPIPLDLSKYTWEGIYVAASKSDQPSYYGPASMFYFVSRIGCYLTKVLQQPHIDGNFQPRGASQNMHTEIAEASEASANHSSFMSISNGMKGLPRPREEALFRLFWEGYHCMYPIIDENEFRKHYASLWEPSRQERMQSPLVDIVLAVCLQYGYAFIPRNVAHPADRDPSFGDAAVAGRWYYRRAQTLLTANLESPSIRTVQCCIFTSIYLCCASFQNMSSVITAQAVRTAQALGLHLEPPADASRGERELRKRLWWTVWILDVKSSTKMGRPFMVDLSQMTVSLPSDDLEVASYNDAALGFVAPDMTWLTYSLNHTKLFMTMIDIYKSFYAKSCEIIRQHSLTYIYANPQALEACAKALVATIPAMKTWVDDLPTQIKMPRRSGAEPFSTDRSGVMIDALSPTWLQRQRVYLELTYHSMLVSLTRPFITFYTHPNTYTPIADRHASICVDHAITFTLIMHQINTESDHMSGWTEFFIHQWNTAITILGFILANPIHPTTPRARQALDKAIAIFDTLGLHFSVSADAARIMRDLVNKADTLMGDNQSSEFAECSGLDAAPGIYDSLENRESDDSLAWLDPSRLCESGSINEVMDWALSIDSFNNLGNFFDTSKLGESLAIG